MKVLVLHSGGMDSSLCLLLACKKFGAQSVVSFGYNYAQRHSSELEAARKIAAHFGAQRVEMDLPRILGWESSSLVSTSIPVTKEDLPRGTVPNSFVPGRNGLFLLMAAPYAKSIGAEAIYIGIMEGDESQSGYPDCSRHYMDLVQRVVQVDLQDPNFRIETPLVHMTKYDTLELAASMGEIEFLLSTTVSCYEGISQLGCGVCPSCCLRNSGVKEFLRKRPQLIDQGIFKVFSPLVSRVS